METLPEGVAEAVRRVFNGEFSYDALVIGEERGMLLVTKEDQHLFLDSTAEGIREIAGVLHEDTADSGRITYIYVLCDPELYQALWPLELEEGDCIFVDAWDEEELQALRRALPSLREKV